MAYTTITDLLKHSIWSMGSVDLSEVPFPEARELVYESFGFNIRTQLTEKTTWKELIKLADEAIYESGDRHHTFIEDFILHGTELELVTGS